MSDNYKDWIEYMKANDKQIDPMIGSQPALAELLLSNQELISISNKDFIIFKSIQEYFYYKGTKHDKRKNKQ